MMSKSGLIIAAMILVGVLVSAVPAQAGGCLLVSAAASLSDVFKKIGTEFMEANPGVRVEFNFAASGALLQQMEMGAPVDVLASADMHTMELAKNRGLVLKGTVEQFAANSLVIIIPTGSKAGIEGPEGLMSSGVGRIAVGNPLTVPAGRYSKDALEPSGVWDEIKDKLVLAENVRQVLDYVRRGEADAGIVYATDAALATNDVRIAAKLDSATPVVYPVAVARVSGDKAAATRFVNYLEGEKAAAILDVYGFGRP